MGEISINNTERMKVKVTLKGQNFVSGTLKAYFDVLNDAVSLQMQVQGS
jgi:hypothetical protein